jgi:hypothetical protein
MVRGALGIALLVAAVVVHSACGESSQVTAPGSGGTPPPSSSLTFTCAVGTAACSNAMQGQAVTFTAGRGGISGEIRSATLDFGDGTSQNLGTLGSPATVTYAYSRTGTFTAQLTATLATGTNPSASQVVQVGTLVTLSMDAIDLGGLNVLATAQLQGAQAELFEWAFERGQPPNVFTTTSQARYTYSISGFKDLALRVRLIDGRVVNTTGSVVVQ